MWIRYTFLKIQLVEKSVRKVTETMMKENMTNVLGQHKSLWPCPLPKGLHSPLPTQHGGTATILNPQVSQGHLSVFHHVNNPIFS